ncbi:uncharacterized protein C1orf167 homolog isoform X2 [Callorhinus ursinus]|uniref:Uncharacterized protein C1orf167 homolog isoform X2 n=1 Tax=Callorhinus ursinus TaxID=34884 RepID=A0A3Q7MXE4_CALUR|nr:uncharacterized protein C1orf167 homolog isoform X2 [Callorhinus ursinus]
MELRPDANHKENVPPRPVAPLRPEQQRFLKSRDVGLGSGLGRWARSYQAQRGGPAATPSPGAELHQEPCRVQTNLAGLSPGLSLVLKDTTGRLINSSLQQQSNLEPPAGRPQGRARELAIQQSNLSMRGTSLAECRSPISPRLWPHVTPLSPHDPRPQGSLACPSSSLRQSRLLATDSLSPDVQPAAGFAPFNGHTRPGSRPWCGLGSWPSRIRGEPLTLEDLTVPVQSQARGPSQTAIHQLLASVRHLEHAVVRLRCQAFQEPSSGQVLPAHAQPSQPVLASWDGRKKHLPGLRETANFPETQGTQAGLSDSQANRKPASLETTLGILPGDFLDPKQGVLLANPLRQGENFSPGPTYGSGQRGDPWLPRGAGSKEARLCSSARSRAARGGPTGQKGGEVTLQEQVSKEEEKMASCPPDAAPARSTMQKKARNVVSLASETARRQWLSRCFGAWWHLVQERQTAAAALALGHRQVLRRGLRALGRAPRLREAQLEVAWRRHTQALLAQSFQKWRNRTLQQKQGQPHVQAGPGPPPSGAGQGQGPSGREPEVDPTRRNSPGSPREEAGAWPKPAGGDGADQMLQVLQQLAVFLLWCHRKEWARQERGLQGEASQVTLRTQRRGRHPQAWCSPAADAPRVASLDTQQRRAWLCRCFGAWQQFVQRAARSRDGLARRRAGSLRLCLQQWVRMKQLRASDGAKVTRLSLCCQKAGQQFLHAKYQRWVQVHLRGLRRSVFQNWRQAAAGRRHPVDPPEQLLLHSHFQAWCGVERDTGVVPATGASQDGPRKAVGATIATWQDARAAKAWARKRRVARASVGRWRSHVQGGQADRQLSRTRAQQAFVAWQAALGQRHKARHLAEGRVALCRTQRVRESRLHRVSRAHAAQKLSARVLEAWAQSTTRGRVQRAAVTQFQQAGSRRLLWTHWAQWQAALLSMRLEPQAEAQEARAVDLRQWPRVANRGRLLALTDTPAPWKQTHGFGTLPSPSQHHCHSGHRKQTEMSWAQSSKEPPLCGAFQRQWQRPGCAGQTQGWPPTRPGGDGSSEAGALKSQSKAARQLGRKYLQRWHCEAPICRLRGPQRARQLAAPGQHRVDAQGAKQLARTLLRQWHLKWAWRVWRQRALRLWVAQRLQQQEGGRVLSQAFEKWRQHLAARGRKRGATSSLIPEPGGHQEPWEQAGSCSSPCGRLEAEQGTQLQL